MQNFLEIGQIVNTFGIKGMVKVVSYADDVTIFKKLKNIYLRSNKNREKYEIEEVKFQNNFVLLKLKGIENQEDANLLKNKYIDIDRKDEPELEDDTYYVADLIGLQVYTDQNVLLGVVDDIQNFGSSDIYYVKTQDGKQILLPGIPDVIKEINLDDGKIIVHIIKGLID